MSIKQKLILLTGVFFAILAAVGIYGYTSTSGMRDFARLEMSRSVDAADGAMESRINYLHTIWGALEAANSPEPELQKQALGHLEEGVQQFPETMQALQQSGIISSRQLETINKAFSSLTQAGRAVIATVTERLDATEELDAHVSDLIEKGLQTTLQPAEVHVIWSLAMAANDYACMPSEEEKATCTQLSKDFSKLNLPDGLNDRKETVLQSVNKVVELTDKKVALTLAFYDAAESLDSIMEVVEEGGQGMEGADAFVERMFDKLQQLSLDQFDNFMLIIGIGALLAICASVFITLSILKPLNNVQAFAHELGTGQLNAQIKGKYAGELLTLKNALQEMAAKVLQEMELAADQRREAEEQAKAAEQAQVQAQQAQRNAEKATQEGRMQAADTLQHVVTGTSAAADQLQARMDEIRKGSDEQQQRITNTATAMEEMNATVLNVAENSALAAGTSEESRDNALQGKKIVSQTIDAIRVVQNSTSELSTVMSELSTKAESIGQVMTVISDIADQTNLLALNAAIEAARAGEAGRGFAVVADEVRKLAEKTMTATKEVGTAIGGIQQSVRTTAEKREQAETALDKTIDLAQEAGTILTNIVSTVEQATDMVRAIATAAEQQSASSEEINRSVEDINQIAAITTENVHNSTKALSELMHQTRELDKLIGELKS